MALGGARSQRGNPDAPQSGATAYPIARSFALTVLLALIGLAVLRHLFGGVSITAGLK